MKDMYHAANEFLANDDAHHASKIYFGDHRLFDGAARHAFYAGWVACREAQNEAEQSIADALERESGIEP